MISTAIILAGGLGTRLHGVIKNVPKPMAPIRNRPFLEYQMDYWIDQGISRLLASKNLDEPFLLLNGDTFFEVGLNDLYSFHNNNNSEWTISLFRSNELERYMGVQLAKSGEVINFKSKEFFFDLLVNGGVYLIDPYVIDKLNLKLGIKTSLEDQLLPSFLSLGGRLFGKEYSGKFIDIGIPEDYSRAHKILSE